MLAATPETVHQRLDADIVAVRAVVDALAHLARDVLRSEVMGHEVSFPLPVRLTHAGERQTVLYGIRAGETEVRRGGDSPPRRSVYFFPPPACPVQRGHIRFDIEASFGVACW
jgi:hypothetical protein